LLPATKLPISSADEVIDGMQQAASSTLAVKFCATVLVTQCTRGLRARSCSMNSAALCASCVDVLGSGDRISSPSAGITRIRFVGLALPPLSP